VCPSTSAQHSSGEAVECAALARHAVAVLIIVALCSCCVKGCILHELMSAKLVQANVLWAKTVHAQGANCTCSALPVHVSGGISHESTHHHDAEHDVKKSATLSPSFGAGTVQRHTQSCIAAVGPPRLHRLAGRGRG
jgi:hypothetical protein